MITAVGVTIALDYEVNPVKEAGTGKFVPCVSQLFDRWAKADPPTTKKLPVKADVLELLTAIAQQSGALELQKAVGNWSLIANYFLIHIGEYTSKQLHTKRKRHSFAIVFLTPL